jgi:hypothetical protein
MFQIMAAIACRSPTFLASTEWKTIPWSLNPSSKDYQQLLLDHFADIPALLAQFDTLARVEAKSAAYSQVEDRRSIFCSLLTGLDCNLRQWKREHLDPRGRPSEVARRMNGPHKVQALVPIFQCRDMSSGEPATPTLITYPDPDSAIAFCLYYSALLVVSLFDIRTEGMIQSHDQYSLACVICRSMEYIVQTFHGDVIMFAMFGLRVAYDTFPEGSFEKQWVKDVFLLLGRESNLRVCTTLMQDFSVLKNGCFKTLELPDVPEKPGSLGSQGELAGLADTVSSGPRWEHL